MYELQIYKLYKNIYMHARVWFNFRTTLINSLNIYKTVKMDKYQLINWPWRHGGLSQLSIIY